MKINDKLSWFQKELQKSDKNIDSLTYKYILDFSEEVLKILDMKNIKNKNKFLAKKLNCSPAYITKLFNGKSNFTVKKLIEIANAIDYTLEIKLRNKLTAVNRETMLHFPAGKTMKASEGKKYTTGAQSSATSLTIIENNAA